MFTGQLGPSQMQFFYTDQFELPLPEAHRFPMSKYRLLRENVADNGIAKKEELVIPPAATLVELCRAHDEDYVQRVLQGQLSPAEIKRIGFPWSPQLVERSRRSTGATIAAARHALTDGVAVNLAGGTHHAFRDAGEGYCVFNDTACASLAMLDEQRIRRGLILDCDVHQGNGTASILQDEDEIFTMSIHGDRNFPLRKVKSDLDVPLPDGIEDDEYLDRLESALEISFDKSRPDIVFYLAGADPFEGDRLGRLKLSKQGLADRDWMVMQCARSKGVPFVVVMAGGYAHRLDDLVDIHLKTVSIAAELSVRPMRASSK